MLELSTDKTCGCAFARICLREFQRTLRFSKGIVMTAAKNPAGFDSNELAQRVSDWASSATGEAALVATQQAAQASVAAAERILWVDPALLSKPATL